MKPTENQRAALEAFLQGRSFRLKALAGTGKTTTLLLMAKAAPQKRILYLAFNASLAREGRAKFPQWVSVRTAHSVAFEATVKGDNRLMAKFRAREGTVLVPDLLEGLEIPEAFGVPRYGIAVAVQGTLQAFLTSTEPRPRPSMVPATALALVEERHRPEFAGLVAALAEKAWERMRDPQDPFPLSHDGYVRLWVERGAPGLEGFEAVLVDEAQDLNPALLAPLQAYAQKGGQLVAVGDPNQAIYAWRGAVNAMELFPGPALPLPESFRFGPPVAEYAEMLMEAAGRPPLGLKGLGGPSEVVRGVGNPPRGAAFVYRTNAGVLAQAAALAGKGFRVEVVGGLGGVASLVEAGVRLMEGQRVHHPELAYFKDYREFARVAEVDPNLKALRRLLETYGKRALEMVRTVEKQRGRDYILSTAHKAKGLEWDVVVLGDDYPPEEKATEEEWNLRYVAATRARKTLDIRWW